MDILLDRTESPLVREKIGPDLLQVNATKVQKHFLKHDPKTSHSASGSDPAIHIGYIDGNPASKAE